MFFLLYLRSIFLLIYIAIVTGMASILMACVIAPFLSRRAQDRFIFRWASVLIPPAGIKLTVLGKEHLKKFKHGILVSNHLGLFDIPVLFAALPISYRMAAKAELFRIPIFGAALRRAGFISIPRQDPVAAKKAVDQSLRHFKNGYSFWMAPEGTRFQGEGVGAFKMGAFALALQTGETILPICLYGPQLVLPKKSLWINVRAPVTEVFVSILPPVDPKGFDWETRHDLKDLVREKIETEFFRLKSVAENKRLR